MSISLLSIKSIPQKVRAVLKKYGTDAHLYLPGVGMVSGFTAGNYQDSAGTTAASVDGLVGLVLDAAGSVGSELSSQTWVATGTASYSTNAGVGSVTNVSNYSDRAEQVGAGSVSGKMYRITIPAWVSSGSAKIRVGQNGASYSELAAVSFTNTSKAPITLHAFTTGGVGLVVQVIPYAGSSSQVVNFELAGVSVKEITGIHASQATAGYKPVERRGIVNLLTYSNDLTNAAWPIKSAGATATTNSVSFTSDTFGRALHSYTHTAGAITVAASFNPADAGKAVRLGVWDSVLDGLTTGGSSSLIIPASGLVAFTTTSSGGAGYVGVIGTGVAVTLSNPSLGLFQGTLTAAQILAYGGIPLTTTVAASSTLGPQYLQFDGVDDFLTLGSVPFQMADDWAVLASVSCSASGASRTIYTHSNASNNQLPWLFFDSTGKLALTLWDGMMTKTIVTIGAVVGQQLIIAARRVGATVILRVNGVLIGSEDVSAMGNPTLTSATIGGFNGGIFHHIGNAGTVIPIKGTVSDADLALLENQAAALAGGRLVGGNFVSNL